MNNDELECPLCGDVLVGWSDENPVCSSCGQVICDWMFEEARKDKT